MTPEPYIAKRGRWISLPLFGIAVMLVALSAALPAAAAADQLVTGTVRACSLSVEHYENEELLRIRAQGINGMGCGLTEDEAVSFLRLALAGLPQGIHLSAISLGRLIDYQWLSAYIAESAATDPLWSLAAGRPVTGPMNAYIETLLSRPRILDRFSGLLAEHGLRASRVTVEKVLVAGRNVRGVPPWIRRDRKVPFDAICFIRLEPR